MLFRSWFNDESKSNETKKYLKDRGWTDQELDPDNGIQDVGFYNQRTLESEIIAGNIEPGPVLDYIKSVVKVLFKKDDVYSLVIPWRGAGGKIENFQFRAIDNRKTNKYLFAKGIEKRSLLFNLHVARHAKTDEIYVVEGAIDALRLTAGGLSNVVALGNCNLNDEHINVLKTAKFRHIILCLDFDGSGEDGTKKAIELISKHELSSYFVAVPSGAKDPDEFLRLPGRTVEEFKNLPRESSLKYITKRSLEIAGSDHIQKNKAVESALSFLEHMPSDPNFGPEHLIELFTEYNISEHELNTLMSQHELKKSENEARQKRIDALKNALKEIENGKPQLEVMGRIIDIEKAVQLIHFVNTFRPYTFGMLVDDCMKSPPVLELDIKKWGKELYENVKLQNGSIIIIAGRPRHGKTTVLLNLLISLCEKYKEKTFAFISYEEMPRDIGLKIISILSGPREKLKNKLAIENAIRNKENFDVLKLGINKFETYTNSGRLLIDCRVMGITDLCNHINFFKNNYNLGAVFVDYIQKITNDNKSNTFSRQNEIQYISGQLLETARSCDIPIVVGAQFSREADKKNAQNNNSEIILDKMKLSYLRESGDLEQDANIVLGLYNADAEDGQKNGQKEHKIDVGILKNRNGLSQISTQLNWSPAEYYVEGINYAGSYRIKGKL